eukprot:TRINITY_DN10645_c0_g1_i1.p1 TRINITY_DN10645_c0_g1~~TRINITY_DN10645_c0_g1_i1.p1  ORF type:complete len:100 (-),score=16.92 TRINITY_DN10645_c0_g1_i1:69-368(-)
MCIRDSINAEYGDTKRSDHRRTTRGMSSIVTRLQNTFLVKYSRDLGIREPAVMASVYLGTVGFAMFFLIQPYRRMFGIPNPADRIPKFPSPKIEIDKTK